MTSPAPTSTPESRQQRYLEILVPSLAFGVTILGIALWYQGVVLNYQYFGIGCIAASCILAYLAWIRPRKDIVALTTPVYAFIFFLVPADDISWILLQVLYAASLTILFLRLKYRFGSVAIPAAKADEPGPLDEYIVKTGHLLSEIFPAVAEDAAIVFIRFAQGDYEPAGRLAETRAEQIAAGAGSGDGPLARAFGIIAEQAHHISQGIEDPSEYLSFRADDQAVLFLPAGTPGLEYQTTLDNALLLVYAAGFSHGSESRKRDLLAFRKFAQKLSGTVTESGSVGES